MTSNIAAAATKDLKNFLGMLRGLLALAEEVEKIGSLEKFARTYEAGIQSLRNEEAGINDRLAKAHAEAQDVMAKASAAADKVASQAAQTHANAEAAAAKIKQAIVDATAEAGAIRAKAKDDAGAILAKAEQSAKALLVKGEATKVAAEQERDAIDAQVKARTKVLEETNLKIAAAEKRLIDVEQQMSALRARFG